MKSTVLFLIVVASSSAVYAQSNPLSSAVKQNYTGVKNNLLKGAEKMPEADYTFKPAPESRTYGAVVTPHCRRTGSHLRIGQRRRQEVRRLEDRQGRRDRPSQGRL